MKHPFVTNDTHFAGLVLSCSSLRTACILIYLIRFNTAAKFSVQVPFILSESTLNINFFYFLATTFLFSIITITIYTKYGIDIHSNLLQSLPATSGLFVAQILVTAQLCFTSAISNTALFQDIEDYLKVPRGKSTYQKLSFHSNCVLMGQK